MMTMVHFQQQRRRELEAYARGDRHWLGLRIEPPATGVQTMGERKWITSHLNLTKHVGQS